MTDELLSLNLEISAYVYELHELQKVIQELAKDPYSEDIYIKEIGERYIEMCNKLRIILEAYFHEESVSGAPIEFSYRKLYKQLTA
jgi:hypothetical protein